MEATPTAVAIRPGNVSKSPWTVQLERDLIAMYRDNAILWDKKHPEYSRRVARDLVVHEISQKLGHQITMKLVKEKIHILRVLFNKHYRSEVAARCAPSSTIPCHSSWVHYESLYFLKPIVQQITTAKHIMAQASSCSAWTVLHDESKDIHSTWDDPVYTSSLIEGEDEVPDNGPADSSMHPAEDFIFVGGNGYKVEQFDTDPGEAPYTNPAITSMKQHRKRKRSNPSFITASASSRRVDASDMTDVDTNVPPEAMVVVQRYETGGVSDDLYNNPPTLNSPSDGQQTPASTVVTDDSQLFGRLIASELQQLPALSRDVAKLEMHMILMKHKHGHEQTLQLLGDVAKNT